MANNKICHASISSPTNAMVAKIQNIITSGTIAINLITNGINITKAINEHTNAIVADTIAHTNANAGTIRNKDNTTNNPFITCLDNPPTPSSILGVSLSFIFSLIYCTFP